MFRVFSGMIMIVFGAGSFESNPNWFLTIGLCLFGLGLVGWPYVDGTMENWYTMEK